MAQVLVTESFMQDIASAIRSKNGQDSSYYPSQMASAIRSIVSASELSIISKTISINGTYTPSSDGADAFSNVIVDVPNTYNPSDEGKVVLSGLLSAQTGMSVSSNGTYDTTSKNQVIVDVPNQSYNFISKTITSNGTYNPIDDNADAFSQVIVNISSGDGLPEEIITGGSFVFSNNSLSVIRSYAFIEHKSILGAYMDNVNTINEKAFYNCSGLVSAIFDKCVSIGSSAFNQCRALQSITFPECTTAGEAVFYACSGLQEVHFPKLIKVTSGMFRGCRSLVSAVFDECISLFTSAFQSCNNLKTLMLPKCQSMSYGALYNCSRLESLYLLSESACVMYNAIGTGTAFTNSTYLGHFGSVYVPASLVDTYKAMSYWSTISDRITAYIEE